MRDTEPVQKLPIPTGFVIPAKAGIQSFQYVLDPPVKPEDDKLEVFRQAPHPEINERHESMILPNGSYMSKVKKDFVLCDYWKVKVLCS